jgi:hypothetical protein
MCGLVWSCECSGVGKGRACIGMHGPSMETLQSALLMHFVRLMMLVYCLAELLFIEKTASLKSSVCLFSTFLLF